MFDDTDYTTTTIILHLFDNRVYMGQVDGHLEGPMRIDDRYPIPAGRLERAGAKRVNELFEAAMPLSCVRRSSYMYRHAPAIPGEKVLIRITSQTWLWRTDCLWWERGGHSD